MRNRKLLYLLIPIIIVLLVLIAGVVFLKLNSTPEKIFEHAISKAFGLFETAEEKYTTMKGTMDFTIDFENENTETSNTDTENTQTEDKNTKVSGAYDEIINKVEEKNQSQNVDTDDITNMINDVYTELYNALEASNISLSMEVDTKNIIVNENLNIVYNNENLLNASIILQDQKGYIYLPDWLNKYLELSEEDIDYTELTEYYNKLHTLDQNVLIESIKEELITSLKKQEFTQEKIEKIKISTLDLSQKDFVVLSKEVLENLKQNEKFNNSLGAYKEDVISGIEDIITDLSYVDFNEDARVVFSIYTKGLFNRFAGFAVELKTGTNVDIGMQLAIGDVATQFVLYNVYDEERTEILNVEIENNKESKNKGTTTITMTAGEEQLILAYNYETKGKGTTFVLSTEIEEEKFVISGNVVQDGKNIKGNITVSVQEESFGKIDVNCAYDFAYDVEVQKADVQNAALIDELSEEDQEEFMTNFQKSKLYELVEQLGRFNIGNDEPEVTSDGYTVKYNIPDGFEADNYNTEDSKMYEDESNNLIYVTINDDSIGEYMNSLGENYILTSDLYENQKISEIKTYTVNGKEYKYRTLSYNDEYGTYAEMHFAYPINEEYYYLVEVETEGKNISMDIIKNFLDVSVLRDMDSLMDKVLEETSDAREQEEALGRGRIYVQGVWYDSVDDYINSNPSENQDD